MSKETLLAEADDKRKAAVAVCNKVADKLAAQLYPFLSKKPEVVLTGEEDVVMSLSVDLAHAQADLEQADSEYQALRRRM